MSDSPERNELFWHAVSARARGDWQEERWALDQIHLLDREES